MDHGPSPSLVGSPLQARPMVAAGGDDATAQDVATSEGRAGASRRPRIAIMGEFSAGKSTLSNLLMGAPALPVRVTATQLPPVWLSYGTDAPHGVDVDGTRFDVDLERLDAVDLSRTRHLCVQRPAEVLQVCDLIDFPGISDPSMPAETWQRAAPLADAVLWCTHATQAWRQSEAAAWEDMPEQLRARSLLLLTRIDKIQSDKDRHRLLSRVRRETEGLFAGIFPVSLTRAIAAGEDSAAFEASGAQELIDALLDLVMRLSRDLGHAIPIAASAAESDAVGEAAVAAAPGGTDGCEGGSVSDRVVPRRVRPRAGSARKPRPPAGSGDAHSCAAVPQSG